MIQSFATLGTVDIFNGRNRPAAGRICPQALWSVAARKLDLLDAAVSLDDLRVLPGNRLEALRGGRVDQFSIRINEQYRICFAWRGVDAHEVEIFDYH